MRFPSRSAIYTTLLSVLTFTSFASAVGQADGVAFYRSVDRLGRIFDVISRDYVQEIPGDSLLYSAVEGLSKVLDPHTAYFNEKETDDLRVHTSGQFGGLGITISIRENVLTVITPLDGTPAQRMGIQAGDRILEIDGHTTHGITVDSAVSQLRGTPGTDVTIKVWRQGMSEAQNFKIRREIIKIESVPWYGMMGKGVGYIKLVQFSEKTTRDLAQAIAALQAKGMKSLVLDLRYNPGGLLDQAQQVSGLFLPKGSLVVSTKGRSDDSRAELRSSSAPLVDSTVPLVVMVNGGSASAAEIVSGAIQDWDRGLVLGVQSFGKGSVQSLRPMDATHVLKLTTAYYYTPSGRCINKKENDPRILHANDKPDSAKAKEDEDSFDEDNDTPTDTVGHTAFKTLKLGRRVWNAGGIVPDVHVPGRRYNLWQQDLERKNLFFRWVIQARSNPKAKFDSTFRASDADIKSFRSFLKTDSVKFVFESPQTRLLAEMRRVLKQDSARGDNLTDADRAAVRKPIDQVDSALAHTADRLFDANTEFIRERLTLEMLMAVGGSRIATPFQLERDPQFEAAKAILLDPARYHQALIGATKAPATK